MRKKNTLSLSKGTQLSNGSLEFLKVANTLFGDLVADFITERLKSLSEKNQKELCWHIIHYMYFEEILPTGNSDVDIKLTEVIEKLPFVNLEVFRFLSRDKIEKMKKSETPQYAS